MKERKISETRRRSGMSKIFSEEWVNEQWGEIVVGIGAGKGRDAMLGILLNVAHERYEAGELAMRSRGYSKAKNGDPNTIVPAPAPHKQKTYLK